AALRREHARRAAGRRGESARRASGGRGAHRAAAARGKRASAEALRAGAARCERAGASRGVQAVRQICKMSKRTLLTYFSTSSSANRGSTSTPNTDGSTNAQALTGNTSENRVIQSEQKRAKVEFRFSDIVGDPGNGKPIEHYAVEIRDQAIVTHED
ncbi:hypothetical protein EJB05_37170, partial [Eragrostis curvula]